MKNDSSEIIPPEDKFDYRSIENVINKMIVKLISSIISNISYQC